MHRTLLVLLSAWFSCAAFGCGSGSGSEDEGPREPLAVPEVDSTTGFLLGSFGFLYPPEGSTDVDALDIDGHASTTNEIAPEQCAHADWSAPGGGEGVDYQFLHLVRTFVGLDQGQIVDIAVQAAARDGSMTILLDTENLDGTSGEPSLQVLASPDAPPKGADGEVLGYGSLTIHEDETLHSDVVPATLEDDVLVAGPVDVRWRLNIQIVETELPLDDAFVRLRMLPDGTATGVVQGFWPLASVREILVDSTTQFAAADDLPGAAGFSKNDFEAALAEHADARLDPATGACTAISTAFSFAAVPAFLVR